MEKSNIDGHKLMYHPKRVNQLLETGDCYPIYVEIGLTNRCNHRCQFCALDFLKHGGYDVDEDTMLSTLKGMAEQGVKAIMFAGEGEPLLHKDIGLFTQKAKQYGLDVAITTNGVPFTKEKREKCLPYLTWIRFSIDSGTPENYALIHGTNKQDFEKVINNIRESVKFKNKHKLETTIGVQTLAFSENISTLENLARICKDIVADNLQIKPYSHHPQSKNDFSISSEEWNEIGEKLKIYENENFRIIHRKQTRERIEQGINFPECFGIPLFTLIDSKGSFSQIWEGDKRKQVLEKMRELGIKDLNCRQGCRLSAINEYLWKLKQGKIKLEKPKGPAPQHINFI